MSLLLERQFYLRSELAEQKYKATADRNVIIITIIIITIIIFLFNLPQFFAFSQYVAKINLTHFHCLCLNL